MDGGGGNGQVKGYRIGGKTGTAEPRARPATGGLFPGGRPGGRTRRSSCSSPMDAPSLTAGTYASGGNMAAPMASKIMADILPYLGVEPSTTPMNWPMWW